MKTMATSITAIALALSLSGSALANASRADSSAKHAKHHLRPTGQRTKSPGSALVATKMATTAAHPATATATSRPNSRPKVEARRGGLPHVRAPGALLTWLTRNAVSYEELAGGHACV